MRTVLQRQKSKLPSFVLDNRTELIIRSRGKSIPTFTRATTAMVEDFEGLLKPVLSGEARFKGARRVYNLVATKSEDWTNAAWTKTTTTATATTLEATAGNATAISASAITSASQLHVLRIRMSRVTGSGDIQLTLDNGGTWTTVTLTGSNQIFSINQTVANPQPGIRIVTNGDKINADQIQVEATLGQTNTNPSEYVSVGVLAAPYHGANVDGVKYFYGQNGNTVSSNVVTEASGSAIAAATLLGYQAEGARTNRCLRSAEFDNAAWVASNITVTANDAVAPDGTTTAELLTATAANGTLIQDLGVVASAAKAGGLWIKRKTGTGTINLTLDNGTGWTAVTVTTSWTRVEMTQTLADEDFGIRIVTNADAVWVWGGQVETAAFLSTDIPTTSAAVTRNADVLTYVTSENINDIQGSAHAEITTNATSTSGAMVLSSYTGVGGAPLGIPSTGVVVGFYDDGAWRVGAPSITMPSATVQKIATAWSPAASSAAVAGTSGAIANFDGNLGLTANFGVGAHVSFSGSPLSGTVRNVRIWPRKLSDSELIVRTT